MIEKIKSCKTFCSNQLRTLMSAKLFKNVICMGSKDCKNSFDKGFMETCTKKCKTKWTKKCKKTKTKTRKTKK